jgi:hypothetical protein
MRTASIVLILGFLLLAAGVRLFYGQDESACHDDEVRVPDSSGAHCEPKPKEPKVVIFPARECVRDFNVKDSAELRVPVFPDGSLNMSQATLQGFDFKLVCAVVKQ